MNKKHWNTVEIGGGIPSVELRRMIDHSYELVVKGLPKAVRVNQRRTSISLLSIVLAARGGAAFV